MRQRSSAVKAAWCHLPVAVRPCARWRLGRTTPGPAELGMITVMCCCRPRWRLGSYGTRSCQQRHSSCGARC